MRQSKPQHRRLDESKRLGAIALRAGAHTTRDETMKQTETEKAISVDFELERTTKNTYRYAETGAIPNIGTLYIQKFALGAEPPAKLHVTVEAI